MERPKFLLAGLLCLYLIAPRALTQPTEPGKDQKVGRSAPSREIPLQEFKLKNGLRVILSEDHSTPTYSVCVTYNVGSRDERPGRTGFAHLFEHMMFQGSENVGKGEAGERKRSGGQRMGGSPGAPRPLAGLVGRAGTAREELRGDRESGV
ncbi:MAG: insulinase family protein [Acidobacteria bacterium]|nr:insulinase family protein [Acidobacteriota bacterium]